MSSVAEKWAYLMMMVITGQASIEDVLIALWFRSVYSICEAAPVRGDVKAKPGFWGYVMVNDNSAPFVKLFFSPKVIMFMITTIATTSCYLLVVMYNWHGYIAHSTTMLSS